MSLTDKDLESVLLELAKFVDERDWEQFHSPKNLASALSVEAAELLEHFQWLTQAESRDLPLAKRESIAEEVADVQVYLLLLAEKLNIDVFESVKEKIEKNRRKYPANEVRGSAEKPGREESR